jgi:hypothetical protein
MIVVIAHPVVKQVQQDGFEYNWMFRNRGWRAQLGPLSSGGYVRRRRWVRLMMKPATLSPHSSTSLPVSAASSSGNLSYRPSVEIDLSKDIPVERLDQEVLLNVWKGDAEGDWERCRKVLKDLGRDGKRLEAWRLWLEVDVDVDEYEFIPEDKRKQDGPANDKNASEAPEDGAQTAVTETRRERILRVLHQHVRSLRNCF